MYWIGTSTHGKLNSNNYGEWGWDVDASRTTCLNVTTLPGRIGTMTRAKETQNKGRSSEQAKDFCRNGPYSGNCGASKRLMLCVVPVRFAPPSMSHLLNSSPWTLNPIRSPTGHARGGDHPIPSKHTPEPSSLQRRPGMLREMSVPRRTTEY